MSARKLRIQIVYVPPSQFEHLGPRQEARTSSARPDRRRALLHLCEAVWGRHLNGVPPAATPIEAPPMQSETQPPTGCVLER